MFTSENQKFEEIHSPHIQTCCRVNESCSQDDYVSQFLGPFPEEKQLEVEEQKQCQPYQEKSQNLESSISQDSQSSFMETITPKVKRSPLHNFQKHFVTTIRRSVIIEWSEKDEEHVKMAKQIWETFKNSKKYTKEFVSLILGNGESRANEKLLKKYGLLPIYQKFGDQDFHKAQTFLRNQVVETFKNVDKEKIIYDRRIGKKEQFATYFLKVLSEIEDGSMNKRLPKKRRNCKKFNSRHY